MGLCWQFRFDPYRRRCSLCHVSIWRGKSRSFCVLLAIYGLVYAAIFDCARRFSALLNHCHGPFSWYQIEDIHLVREEDTGKSRGFAFVKYEDARSAILAVDNFTGSKVRNSEFQKKFFVVGKSYLSSCSSNMKFMVCEKL